MTLPKHALTYGICSLEELQRFVKERKLSDDPPEDPDECIALLQVADEKATFRFTDLIGELRNKV